MLCCPMAERNEAGHCNTDTVSAALSSMHRPGQGAFFVKTPVQIMLCL